MFKEGDNVKKVRRFSESQNNYYGYDVKIGDTGVVGFVELPKVVVKMSNGKSVTFDHTELDAIEGVVNKYSRHTDIFNPQLYDQYGVSIIGCGGVGSGVGIILAKLGMQKFELYDSDVIEEHNLSNQYFKDNQLGYNKTSALSNNMYEFNRSINTNNNTDFTSKNVIKTPIVFCCVDSMKARKIIFNKCKKTNNCKLFIDTRMGGETFEVFIINMTKKRDVNYYEKNLFPDKEAVQLTCSAKTIIYNVMAIASCSVALMSRVLNGQPYKREITGDLFNLMIK